MLSSLLFSNLSKYLAETPIHSRLYLLTIALLPLMWPIGTAQFGSYLYLADAAAALTLLAWVVALFLGRARLRGSWFYALLVLYLGSVAMSVAASVDSRRSLAALPIEIYVIGLAVLSYNLVRTTADLHRVFLAWMVGTAITAACGVLGVILFYVGVRDEWNFALVGYGSLPEANYPRVSGLFLNVNMACNYLSVSMLFLLAMRRLDWIGVRLFRSLMLLICIMAIFTVSPGLGGILLGVGIWLWVRWRSSRPMLARFAMAGGCAASLSFLLAIMISPANSGGQGIVLPIIQQRIEVSNRVESWEAAWRTTLRNPLVGQGIGVPIEIPDWTAPSGDIQHHTDAHNVYLNIAAHDGLFGVLALLAFAIYMLLKSGPLTFDGSADNLLRTALAIAFIQAFLYQGLSGSFEHTRHLWVLCGLLISAAEISKTDGSDLTAIS